VTLALCERVSGQLNDYRERYSLEVSSPGTDRPLTKPQHYTRFLGRRARVRLRDARDGHRSLTGELVGASDQEITIAADDGVVTIPYDQIARSNLIPGD
jgi:ribosome maturation factor RimP